MERSDLLRRLHEYAGNKNLAVESQLGFGVHGIVFTVHHQTHDGLSAVKVHERERDYARERDVYLRLHDNRIGKVRGCNVPELLDFDNDLWAIEMSIVKRPFVLDFARAFLDRAPEFSDEVLAEWEAEKRDQFGRRWPDVLAILRELETFGIFMIDVNTGNISFGD
jgi:hypothetical protein